MWCGVLDGHTGRGMCVKITWLVFHLEASFTVTLYVLKYLGVCQALE